MNMRVAAPSKAIMPPQNAWRWPLHALLAGMAILVTAVVCVWLIRAQKAQSRMLATQISQLQTQVTASERKISTAYAEHQNFTERLPRSPQVDEVIDHLGKLAQNAQIKVGSVSFSKVAEQHQDLERIDLSVTFSGAYSPTKQLLSQWMARFDNLALRSLSIQPRSNDTSSLEWAAVLSLYAKGRQ